VIAVLVVCLFATSPKGPRCQVAIGTENDLPLGAIHEQCMLFVFFVGCLQFRHLPLPHG
jgi:hypothetical protein